MNNSQYIMLFVAGGLLVAFIGVMAGGDFFVDKVADRVIEKLQKPYGPSPYGPGFDPDKINVNAFNRGPVQPQGYPPQGYPQQQPQFQPQVQPPQNNGPFPNAYYNRR
tara:strand:- start:1386 stop:1709 length:324 start_codon:yes stop_codon:yes gene_type:complete